MPMTSPFWALHPDSVVTVLSELAVRLSVSSQDGPLPAPAALPSPLGQERREGRGYVVTNGVAVIPIIPLDYPVKLATGLLSELTMRRPTLKEQLDFKIDGSQNLETEVKLYSRLTGVSVAELHKLDLEDYEKLPQQYNRFRQPQNDERDAVCAGPWGISAAVLYIKDMHMNIMEQLIALERRVAELEANRAPSLRFAEVTEVDKAGKARVKLLDGDDMVSHPLRTLQRRTLKDKDQCFPDIGEHVACLFSGQGLETGVLLGAVYSDKNQTDGEEGHFGYYRYEDGTMIYYDRDQHKLYADVKGEVEIKCEKSATVEAQEDVTVTSGQTLILEGASGIRLRAPSISFEGIKGGACKARIEGNVEHIGNMERQGDTAQNGNITASGAITGNPVHGCPH